MEVLSLFLGLKGIGSLVFTILLGLLGIYVFLKFMYVQASPNEVVIITGARKKQKTLVGKGGFIIPFFDKVSKLSLELASVDIKTSESVPTLDYIDVFVDAVAKVQIPNDTEMIEKASKNFLNKDRNFISEQVVDVLEGNIREIVGAMELRDLVNDRKAFIDKVQNNAQPDLNAMGLQIITFNVQNFKDNQEVIENLGIDNISKIKKEASIARQDSEKEVSINKSKNDREANEAEVEARLVIAQRQNDLKVREAELEREANVKQAIADASYEIEKEKQRVTQEQMTAEANAVKEQQNIEIQKSVLQADHYNKQDAELYAKIKEAEGIKELAKAKAEAIRLEGAAEAERIRQIGIAEAEATEKRAEAMKQYGEAAILETAFKAYVQMSENVVKPLEKVDTITMYGEGNQAKLVGDTTKTITQLDNALKDALGVDVKGLVEGFLTKKQEDNEQLSLNFE